MVREIEFYKMKDGKCPVDEFLDSLPGKVVQKITWLLEILESQGFLPINHFKKLKSTDIWECRIQFGNNIYRILGFFSNNSVLVLTHGFIKKTQKTPKNEIERSENYKNDYFQRGKV
jgi:phage-related protein